MEVNDKLVNRLAELSKLEFKGEELKQIKGDLEKIVEFMDQLSAQNTDDVEPLVYVNEVPNRMREDEAREAIVTKEDALKNAPDADSDYIKISKVL